ncbi:ribonuclease H-like domain-containing protein [Tanacetum coccineum]
MDDPNMTMEEYIKLEEEKARRHGWVFNWETTTYGKIRVDNDLHGLGSVEAEFPAIVIDDAFAPQDTLLCKSQRLMIEQYFQVQVYALWDVIENGNSFKPAAKTTTNADGTSTTLIPGPVTTEEKTLFAAIQTRFGGNEATKKTQKTLLKQIQLAILGENISQEDLNLKFLRSLSSELNTHVVVWRNKPDLDTVSFDNLYNNFKIVEKEVNGTSSLSSSSQNMAFVVSPASTQVSNASTQVSTANLSDDIVYAFLASQLNGSQLVYEDLKQIHEDDIEEIDLKCDTDGYDKSKVECFNCHKMRHFARECRGPKNQDNRNKNQDSSKRTVNVDEISSKAMLAIDGADSKGYFYPNLDLSYSGLEEFQQPEFEGYGPKPSKSVSEDTSNEVKESSDALLVEELVSDDKLEKKTIFPTVAKIELLELNNKKNQLGNQSIVNAVRANQVNAVKALACYVWRPTKLNSASIPLKRHNYGHPQKEDQGYVDSGCSRHMTGNMSYLSDFKEFDGGYVTFRGGAKGGKITGKGTLKTGKLDFEDVYFVKELQFNHFSVLQMCDKKNSVLFTNTGCFVLSPDFKLADESQVLLKVPRKNNMYSVDMKNIVPKESLTCLVAKATLDESMLWHRRLGHVNFKTINKLVKDNLVRGLPSKRFENDQTCVACLKGKQHKASYEGFFIGYSLNSKAFRVYNIRTMKVEESLHIRFLEDKPIIACDGPKWLFDIDVLTKLMNFVPVVAGTNSNDLVGTEESIGIGHSSKETGSSQDNILMPLWKDGSLFDSSSKNANNDEPQPFSDAEKNDNEGVTKESGIDDQERLGNNT